MKCLIICRRENIFSITVDMPEGIKGFENEKGMIPEGALTRTERQAIWDYAAEQLDEEIHQGEIEIDICLTSDEPTHALMFDGDDAEVVWLDDAERKEVAE